MSDSKNSKKSNKIKDSKNSNDKQKTSKSSKNNSKGPVQVESKDGNVPEVLQEPVLLSPTKKKKPIRDIDINAPKDKMQLVEAQSPSEFDSPEAKLNHYNDNLKSFFDSKPKKNNTTKNNINNNNSQNNNKNNSKPVIKLELWEYQLKYLYDNLQSDENIITIPILSASNSIEIFNISRFSSLLKSLKKHNKNTISAIAGNFTGTSGFSSTSFKGKHMIDLFNKCQIDFIIPGKDEYNLSEIDFTSRIKEFHGTTICSNLLQNVNDSNNASNSNNTSKPVKFSKMSSYVIRTVKEIPICFFGISYINDVNDINDSNNENKIPDYLNILNLEQSIDKVDDLLRNKLKDKYKISVGLSSLNFLDNEIIANKISKLNLILGSSGDKNILMNRGKNVRIVESDNNFKSCYLNILKYDKVNSKLNILSFLVNLDDKIPEDSEILLNINYWKDLGFRELNTFGKIDCNLKLCTLKKRLKNEEILKNVFDGILDFVKNNNLDAKNIILRKEIFNIDYLKPEDNGIFEKIIYGYDIYRLIPFDDSLVLLEISSDILHILSCKDNLFVKYLDLEKLSFEDINKLEGNVKILSSESTIEKIISLFIEGEIEATVLEDIRICVKDKFLSLNS